MCSGGDLSRLHLWNRPWEWDPLAAAAGHGSAPMERRTRADFDSNKGPAIWHDAMLFFRSITHGRETIAIRSSGLGVAFM